MKSKLVKIGMWGTIGQAIGKEQWELNVSSVGEACHAVEVLSGRKLYRHLMESDRKGIMYEVLVNGRRLMSTPKDVSEIQSSELICKVSDLESVDIVPVLQGADPIITPMVLGVILVGAGIKVGGMIGVALFFAGIGMVATGVINLLSSPPAVGEFRDIQGPKRGSYLFNGPQNTVGEGGPVPVLFGELIVGSHAIAASYNITDVDPGSGLTI